MGLLLDILIFLLLLFCHILLWRTRMPKNPKKALFSILLLGNILLTPTLVLFDIKSVIEIIYFLIFYNSLVLLYIFVVYMQLEGESPTLSILRYLGDHKSGRTKEEVFLKFSAQPFFETRMHELTEDGAVLLEKDKVTLNPRNGYIKILFAINAYRNVLGLKDARG